MNDELTRNFSSPLMGKSKTPKTKGAEPFKLHLKIGNAVYESEGATPFDALKALPKPDKIMLTGIFTISQGDKKRSQRMMPGRLKRYFFAPHFQAILAKQLAVGMK